MEESGETTSTSIDRRVFLRSAICGGGTTLAVLLLWLVGMFVQFEDWLYDRRLNDCQYFQVAPSDRIVHMDIDDASLEEIGRWPWPRATLARLLDEIRLAGPKAVSLDIMFAEPQESAGPRAPGHSDDELLAVALGRYERRMIAVSVELPAGVAADPLAVRCELELRENLELTADRLTDRLLLPGENREAKHAAVQRLFLGARRSAMLKRIRSELDQEEQLPEILMARLLPNVDPTINSPLQRLFVDQYARASGLFRASEKGVLPAPGLPDPFPVQLKIVPIPMLTAQTTGLGFVDYEFFFRDPIVRSVPMLLIHDGRIIPQLGLLLACQLLDADISKARVEHKTLIIPAPDREIRIPVWSYKSERQGRLVPYIADVPWFGGHAWETMYDWPAQRESKQHISMNYVMEACRTIDKIRRNNANIDRACANLLDDEEKGPQIALDPAKWEKYLAGKHVIDDVAARRAMGEEALKILTESGYEELYASTENLNALEKLQFGAMRDARAAISRAMLENDELVAQRDTIRADLKKLIGGRGIIIGYTGSGTADVVPTPMHTRCPGVVVHGVIANAVVSGNWLTRAPMWVTIILTLLLGFAAAALDGWLSPLFAAAYTILLGSMYMAINGILLFDYFDTVVEAAPPLLAVLCVWAACSVQRLAVEIVERTRLSKEKAVVDHEISLARRVQAALIPKSPPEISGIISNGWTMAATTTGGDAYDLWILPDGRMGIMLGDASGHGLAPCLIVSQVRSLIRVISEMEDHPQKVLERVNARIAKDVEMGRFCTCFLGYLSSSGALHSASAGHGPVLVSLGEGMPLQEIDATCMPLGVMDEWMGDEPAPPLQMDSGGMLVVMSDGIFEAHSPANEQFGTERVIDLINANLHEPPEVLIDKIRTAVKDWYAGNPPEDDQTLVIVKRQ